MSKTKAEHTAQAAFALMVSWNELYPVGTPVLVVRDNGEVEETKTRIPAWVTPSGSVQILLEGIRGSYRLSRVIPIPKL